VVMVLFVSRTAVAIVIPIYQLASQF